MKQSYSVLTRVIFILSAIGVITGTIYAGVEVKHATDPRGKIEKILGEGNFAWAMTDAALAFLADEAKETGIPFTVKETTWTARGGGQDWVLTRVIRMEEDKEPMVRKEKFWISILRVNGIWFTRTKYRYRIDIEGNTREVTQKDKGGKFTARCLITGKKILLAVTRKKKGYIFKITGSDGLMQVSYISTHQLIERTATFKKQ